MGSAVKAVDSVHRVAILSDSFAPRIDGISTSVGSLLDGFCALGIEVSLFVPRSNGLASGENTFPGVTTYGIRSVNSRLDGYPFALASRKRIANVLQAFNPQFVSIQTLGPIGLAGLRAAKRLRLPVALHWHTDFEAYARAYPLSWPYIIVSALQLGRDFRSRLGLSRMASALRAPRLLERALRLVANHSELIVVPSIKTARNLHRLNIESPIFVLPTGVHREEIAGITLSLSVKRRIEQLPRGGRIIYVGRLSREKDLQFLVDVFDYIASVEPSSRLILIGPCNDRSTLSLLRSAQEMSRGRIVVFDAVPRQALLEFYKSADIFIAPSVTETQGITIWEARISGLPVVARDGAVCDELPDDEWVVCGGQTPEELGDMAMSTLSKVGASEVRAPCRLGQTETERAAALAQAVAWAVHEREGAGRTFQLLSGRWNPA